MSCFVYVMGVNGGPYKVGYSKSPQTRLRAINQHLPGVAIGGGQASILYQIDLVSADRARFVERAVHARLASVRHPWPIRGSAFLTSKTLEWFSAPLGQIVFEIEALVQVEMPDARPAGRRDSEEASMLVERRLWQRRRAEWSEKMLAERGEWPSREELRKLADAGFFGEFPASAVRQQSPT